LIVGVRHGTVLNPDHLVYARLPAFHLAEEGRRESRELAQGLARAPLAAVHASPLERAVETAAILAEPHGLPVQTDERLLEWSFWMRWQGMPWTAIRERNPELLQVYGDDPASAGPEDPLGRVGARVLDWAADADRAHPEGLVLGVTHEAPLLAALFVGSGRDLSGFHDQNLPHLGCVRLRPGPAQIVDLLQWARTC
jgi:broad specificity phosphatase PhoE